MIATFVHPISKRPLIPDPEGNLMYAGQEQSVLRHIDGCYNFTDFLEAHTQEQAHYDSHYHHSHKPETGVELTKEYLKNLWDGNSSFNLLYETVGDIQGKDILLLGNGTSVKEFSFVMEGGDVVYTDLSVEAALFGKKCFENSALHHEAVGRVQFHTVDALHMPFADESFDLIYGCAVVHHIQELHPFFAEVYRCLKNGGKCIFLDDAESKWWNVAKKTILRPLQIISHRRTGISPEDKLATERGGYGKEELRHILTMQKFSDLTHKRTMFFEHLIRRGMMKLLHESLGRALVPLGRFVDNRLLGPRFMKRNGLLLVWGAQKGR